MLPKIVVLVSVMAVAIGGPSTRPPLRPEPRTYPPRNEESCGNFPNFMIGDRIVGGEAAALPIPWQVSVRQGNWHFCGGTILDKTTVMCAAHCFDKDQSMSGYYIKAGVKDKNENGGQTIEIANGVWNADMPYEGNNNDFIILKLKNALTFNDNVGPACLPDPDHAPDATGQTCFVSGWGTLESGGSSPDALQWVAVPTVTNLQCNNAYNGITDSMICAGLPEGGKDSCQGDSGGPFICRDNGKAVLTGVVSFGIGCALPDYPGVYARVTAVLDWVKANMGGSAPPPPGPTQGPTTAGPPPGPTECPTVWIGDNYCDDICNNDDNQFDGGDCCKEEVNTLYCSVCECIDESTEVTEGPTEGPIEGSTEGSTEGTTEGTTIEPIECVDSWIGDNYCDDQNNNDECGYDGGDCCQEEAGEGWNQYCTDCLCLEAPIECVDSWIGDNYCDDQNNNDECDYDGGDCCQEAAGEGWDQYCNDCQCLEAPIECVDAWIGDNYCDDQNNNSECDFDGGDCCGDNINTQYCTECQCLAV